MYKTVLETIRNRLAPISVFFAFVWVVGFTLCFHRLGLPNNQPHDRWMLWTSLPYNMLDLIDPPTDQTGDVRWGLIYLGQRLPFALIAVAIWTSAWGIGARGLRWLGIRTSGCEHFFLSTCLGLSGVSLIMLLLGLLGSMSRWPLIFLLASGVALEIVTRRNHPGTPISSPSRMDRRSHGFMLPILGWVVAISCIPFVLGALLGAMSPQVDFDVVEYHLGGPKEWFQQGRIVRLPHNVYTSFPFLTEMLILSGMVLSQDWQWGALAGQAVIAGFAPLTAIGLVAAGRRFFTEAVGWIAALIYLTSPWTYRISIIAYAEGGLACYLFAALYAALMYRQQIIENANDRSARSLAILAGLLAGSAMACKYTGLVSVVIPIGLILIWATFRNSGNQRFRRTFLAGLLYSAGVGCAVGPWLVKNGVETGNPVYPLAVRIFGGKDRDVAIDAKWRHAHAAKSYPDWTRRMNDLPVKIADVAANNDWHSPLMFSLAPLSVLVFLRRRESAAGDTASQIFQFGPLSVTWLYVIWQFFSWWLLTHHIDRFYVPMFSAVALLAGVGVRWWEPSSSGISTTISRKFWNSFVAGLVAVSMLYNANVMLCLGGFNAGRRHLIDARDRIAIAPRIRWINEAYESGLLPRNTKVLCVGEALLFHARYPYIYNTVFDHSLFEQICKAPGSSNDRMRPAAEIRDEFRRLGITHVDVNWSEILRYREPDNYGYTDFVHPDRFEELQQSGVLGPQCLPAEVNLEPLNNQLKSRLEQWAPKLITTYAGKPAYISAQMFQVLDEEGKELREMK